MSMLSAINLTIFILWVLSAASDYSEFCYVWQLKEYRFDRFRDFIHTRQGQFFLRSYGLLWRSIGALTVFLWPLNEVMMIKYIIIGVLGFDAVRNIMRWIRHAARHPRLTPKVFIILSLSLFIEGMVFLVTRDWSMLLLLLALRFGIITAVIRTLAVPTQWAKQWYIHEATKKIARYPKLLVIGITGSYGKTTTKEFMAHILSAKFRVVKTPKNTNTEIGIARFILNTDFTGAEVFVVEMAAYRIGEIKLICGMVHPTIGVLTAINEQHLSLFGSIKNTQSAKYELLRALPATGLAIINSDNPYCREFIHQLHCSVMTFGSDDAYTPTLLIEDMKTVQEGITAKGRMRYQGQEYVDAMTVPVKGEHNILNVAPCVLVAVYLELTEEQVKGQLKTLTMPEGILQTYAYGKSVILDDSYNANPNGFKAALAVLSTYPSHKKRVVITRGMIELGDRSSEIHEKIGNEITFCADEVVIISPDSLEALRKGMGDKYQTNILLKYTPEELLEYVKSLKGTEVVILLENRVPSVIHDELHAV